jgi:hypothetical protein
MRPCKEAPPLPVYPTRAPCSPLRGCPAGGYRGEYCPLVLRRCCSAFGHNMDDLELAQRVSARTGELYREAKRSRHSFPNMPLSTHARLRACAATCFTSTMRGSGPLAWTNRSGSWTGFAASIPPPANCCVPRLTGVTRQHILGLARWTMRILERWPAGFCGLDRPAWNLFRQHGGAALPDYDVVDELREVCYRAMPVLLKPVGRRGTGRAESNSCKGRVLNVVLAGAGKSPRLAAADATRSARRRHRTPGCRGQVCSGASRCVTHVWRPRP